MATLGIVLRFRLALLASRLGFMFVISRRSLDILFLIRRRSSSILVSPGPREPIPPPAAPTLPPAWRDKDSPHPRRRGSKYSSWASSTWALPSLDLACWAKMSSMRAVRSITLIFIMSSKARRCEGVSSLSTITVSAPFSCTICFSSRAFPEPMKVLVFGCVRFCIKASKTSDPAVSAKAASSFREFSVSVVVFPKDMATKTTFSKRSLRYSTSLTSASSVDNPTMRLSACLSCSCVCWVSLFSITVFKVSLRPNGKPFSVFVIVFLRMLWFFGGSVYFCK